jgi:hypothetical protein
MTIIFAVVFQKEVSGEGCIVKVPCECRRRARKNSSILQMLVGLFSLAFFV